MKNKAFTLIELLVVIAIIALLLSIVVPSLRLAKQKAASVVCMTNAKNLALGWFCYKEDNHGHIMSANMGGLEDSRGVVKVPGWINEPYNTTPGDRECTGSTVVTDEDEIRGIEGGALYPYLKSPGVFNCPADKVISRYDFTEKFVTFSIPISLNGWDSQSDCYNLQIKKFSEITSPSTRYNFVETAEERNWTMSGHFVIGSPEYTGMNTWGWWNPMAVNHGDSSILGFCDGHTEAHKWQDSFTKERVDKLSRLGLDYYDVEYPPEGQTEDIAFMAKGWPFRYKN